jgi:hypothetical protein
LQGHVVGSTRTAVEQSDKGPFTLPATTFPGASRDTNKFATIGTEEIDEMTEREPLLVATEASGKIPNAEIDHRT